MAATRPPLPSANSSANSAADAEAEEAFAQACAARLRAEGNTSGVSIAGAQARPRRIYLGVEPRLV